MDSDDIFYGIFVAAIIVFTVLNSIKKGKQNTNDEQHDASNGQWQQSSPHPIVQTPRPREYSHTNSQTAPNITDEIRRRNSEATGIPQPPALPTTERINRKRHSTPPPPPTDAPNQRYFIESPDQEGGSVTEASTDTALSEFATASDKAEDAYSLDDTAIPNSKKDWRNAIIAHEVLKRKF